MVPQKDPASEFVFTCRMCGECCTSWNIPLEGEKAEVLVKRGWVLDRLRETRRSLEAISKEVWRIPLTRENYCVFLAEDKRCLIEHHEGPELKPQHCKNFPFAAISMPDGSLSYDTSAVCTRISEDGLETFLPMVPNPQMTAIERDTLPKRIRVTRFRTWEASQYLDYIEGMTAVFADPEVSWSSALADARIRLRWPDRVISPPAEFCFHPRWERWMPAIFLRKPYNTVSFFAILGEGEYRDTKLFEGSVPLRGHREIVWAPGGEAEVLLKAFLLQLLQRKVLLTFGHSLVSILTMTTVAGFLVRWYARAFALLLGKTGPDRGDVILAIQMVERYYTGHQPRFPEVFRTSPVTGILERVLFSSHKGF